MTNDDIRSQITWLRGELARREDGNPQPTADDARYVLSSIAPTILEHGIIPYLNSRNLWQGRSYRLTNGQRGWLRQRYDMTPAATVTVVSLVLWQDSPHPREMTLRSDEHINSSRKHVLNTVILHEVGTFLRESAERDAESRSDGVGLLEKSGNANRSRKDSEFARFAQELQGLLTELGL